jgi:hypothetical protein
MIYLTTPITDWGAAIYASLAGALALLFSAVPRIIGFVLVMLIGWFMANLIARVVAALLRTVIFNDLAKRAGISEFVRNTGIRDPTGAFAGLVLCLCA